MFRVNVIILTIFFAHLCLIYAIKYTPTDITPTLVSKYVKIVQEGINNSLKYKQTVNAHEFYPNTTEILDYGTFDFIIIGSGASGSVIANRLTEIKAFHVLLLEAGHFEDEFVRIPGLMSYSGGTDFNWGLKSIPQKNACLAMDENRCQLFRGRGIGGSTIVSPLIYTQPLPSDFDKWSKQNPSWSYQNIKSYYERILSSGLLKVEIPDYTTPHIDAFLSANEELGVDYNSSLYKPMSRQVTGSVSRVNINTKNGRRLSVGDAYILPITNRRNLNITLNSYVTKILINDDKKTVGVLFSKENQINLAMVKKEVILSAGAISSPQILTQSGFGSAKKLEKLGIDVKLELENVGKNYQTHVGIFGLSIQTNTSIDDLSLKGNVRLYLHGKGVYTMGGNRAAIGYYNIPKKKTTQDIAQEDKQEESTEGYDIELVFLTPNRSAGFYQSGFAFKPEKFKKLTNSLHNEKTFSVFITPRYPKSIGSIEIISPDPYDFPSVDPNLLSDSNKHDINAIYQGIKLLQRMLKTKAMKKIGAELKYIEVGNCKPPESSKLEDWENDNNETDDEVKHYWHCFIRQTSDELFHPVGTNKMASSGQQDGVVSDRLNVLGLSGLRIADASIIPYSMTGHPTATCVMIGERCSDFIKNDYGNYAN